MTNRFIPLLILVFSSACVLARADETLATKRQSFSAAGVTGAVLETGAGSLTVTGRPGAGNIDVSAEFKGNPASKEEAERILNNLRLTMEVRGNTFYLKTEQIHGWSWNQSGRIDLTIDLPASLSIDIDDGSGSTYVSAIDNDVRIKDGSGDLEVDGIQGSLQIDDGSGGIRLRDISRNVRIEDGSGSIDIQHVGGDVTIEDGSGSIDVVDVGGSLDVPRDGSGSIDYRDIRGRVEIPRKKR